MTTTRGGVRVTRDNKPHPLEGLVLKAFKEHAVLDVTLLIPYLSGTTSFMGRGAVTGNRAYRTVAKDVLGYMQCQGRLVRDGVGWYRLAPCPGDPEGRRS